MSVLRKPQPVSANTVRGYRGSATRLPLCLHTCGKHTLTKELGYEHLRELQLGVALFELFSFLCGGCLFMVFLLLLLFRPSERLRKEEGKVVWC